MNTIQECDTDVGKVMVGDWVSYIGYNNDGSPKVAISEVLYVCNRNDYLFVVTVAGELECACIFEIRR